MSLSLTETLCHFLQIQRLVVGIQGAELQPCPPVHNADIQLCAELHRLAGFSPHDRTNKRLADADDPVGNGMGMIIVHVLLLLIDGADGVQKFSTGQHDVNGLKVTAEVGQLLANRFAGGFGGVFTASCVLQVTR